MNKIIISHEDKEECRKIAQVLIKIKDLDSLQLRTQYN